MRSRTCAAAIALAFAIVTSSTTHAGDVRADDATSRAAPSPSAAPPSSSPSPPGDRFVPYPPPTPRILEQPDRSYTYADSGYYPSLAWIALQLVPSPEVAAGQERPVGPVDAAGKPLLDAAGRPIEAAKETKTAFGLRWQLSPVVWSWGTNRRVSRWRFFVVDPLARHSGSLELSTSFEYIFGYVDRAIVRPGVRAYFPLAQRGEYLSASLGTSTYAYDQKMHVAYDVGAYVLFGLFGVQVTVAPNHDPLMAIGTFRIRYF